MSIPQSRYVYRFGRDGKRARRSYLGTLADPAVQALLASERLAKATRKAEQSKSENELKIVETADACLQLIHSSADRAKRDLRKRWRRSNQTRVKRLMMSELKFSQNDYEALVADAADGDMDALARLRQLLKENPQLRSILGDLNAQVQHYLIELAAGGAIDVRLSLTQQLAEKREELLSAGDSLPEEMLVDQILTTMIDAAVCQLGHSQQHAKESISRRWERRLTAAQTRHQAAIQALLEVRQMLEVNFDTGE